MNPTHAADAVTEITSTLAAIVKALVTRPDSVKVEHSEHGPLVAFRIHTDQDDVRRVIGSKGKHFKALEAIAASLCRILGRESHLLVDDKGPPPIPTATSKGMAFTKFDPKNFAQVQPLLARVIGMFTTDARSVDVNFSELGTTAIFVVKVTAQDYPRVMGPMVTFDYGQDGATFGAIKNIFDGIGKNHGRIIRIVLNNG